MMNADNDHFAFNSLDDMEQALLGAVINTPQIIGKGLRFGRNDFSNKRNQSLYNIIAKSLVDGRHISTTGIKLAAGGAYDELFGDDYINRLIDKGADIDPITFDDLVKRIREVAMRREMRALARKMDMAAKSESVTPDEAMADIIKSAENLMSGGSGNFEVKRDIARRAKQAIISQGEATKTGIAELDIMLQGGLRRTRTYCLSARFGRGKTILAGSVSDNIIYDESSDRSHLFVSMETPNEDREIRSMARAMDLNASDIYDPESPHHEAFLDNIDDYIEQAEDRVIYEHRPGMTLDELMRSIIEAVFSHNIEGVFIDYFQLIEGREKGQNLTQHYKIAANRLAALARRHNIWIVIMAQEDENGDITDAKDALHTACSCVINFQRDPNDSEVRLSMKKSNYSRLSDSSSQSANIYFNSEVGPYFSSRGEN